MGMHMNDAAAFEEVRVSIVEPATDDTIQKPLPPIIAIKP
jgi:hypothetical protein